MSRITTAESAFQTANSLFVDENFEEALTHYTEAIELSNSDTLDAQQTNQKADTFIKRSTCYYKLGKFEESLNDANEALKLQPSNAKALMRKGMALFSLEEYEAAKSAFEKGQSLDSSNSQFRTWIRKCATELESEGTPSKPAVTQMETQPTTQNAPTPSPVESPVTSNTTTASSVSTAPAKVEPKFRHEWYQTQTHVVVTVFAKGVTKEQTKVDIQERSLCVTIKLSESNDYQLDMELFDKVVPSESTTMYGSTKIEVKLKKGTSARWNNLEDTGEKKAAQFEVQSTAPAKPAKKNWDKIVTEVTKGEQLDGEDALNKVFQDIYSNGSEEQKRAMMKSFVESGGTVLSTNWDEVGKAPVKGSPPDGMEMHKWDELTTGKKN